MKAQKPEESAMMSEEIMSRFSRHSMSSMQVIQNCTNIGKRQSHYAPSSFNKLKKKSKLSPQSSPNQDNYNNQEEEDEEGEEGALEFEQQVKKIESKDPSEATVVVTSMASYMKIKAFFSLICFALMFSAYFLATYVHTNDSLKTTSAGIQDISLLYIRGTCPTKVLNTLSQETLMNLTLSESALHERLMACYDLEANVTSVKQDGHNTLNQIQPVLFALDSQNLCNIAFSSQNSSTKFSEGACQLAFNRIFEKGLSTYYQVLYQKIMKAEFSLYNSGNTTRSYKDLLSLYNDPDILLLIFTTEFITFAALDSELLALKADLSAYMLASQKVEWIMFSVMLVLMLVSFILFVVIVAKRMKATMINCNSLLKVLPFEFIDIKTLEKMKHFLTQ